MHRRDAFDPGDPPRHAPHPDQGRPPGLIDAGQPLAGMAIGCEACSAGWAAVVAGGVPAVESRRRTSAQLTLNDPYWDRVNVEVVVTTQRRLRQPREGYVSTKEVVMHKNRTETIDRAKRRALCAGGTTATPTTRSPARGPAGPRRRRSRARAPTPTCRMLAARLPKAILRAVEGAPAQNLRRSLRMVRPLVASAALGLCAEPGRRHWRSRRRCRSIPAPCQKPMRHSPAAGAVGAGLRGTGRSAATALRRRHATDAALTPAAAHAAPPMSAPARRRLRRCSARAATVHHRRSGVAVGGSDILRAAGLGPGRRTAIPSAERYRPFIGIWSDASWTPSLCAALIVENVDAGRHRDDRLCLWPDGIEPARTGRRSARHRHHPRRRAAASRIRMAANSLSARYTPTSTAA